MFRAHISAPRLLVLVPFLTILKLTGCSDQQVGGNGTDAPPTEPADGGPDGATTRPKDSPCKVTKDGTAGRVYKGTLLLPESVVDGEVFIDNAGAITCAGKSCSGAPGYASAAIVTCLDAVISPGLINPHDHITYANNPPHRPTDERYEHRHDWRKGLRGHTEIKTSSPPDKNAIPAAELRFLMSGVTTTAGAGASDGLIRNVDASPAQLEGLRIPIVDSDTFPLKDSAPANPLPTTCAAFPTGRRTAASIVNLKGYLPHMSEGIDTSANEEFICQSNGDATPDLVHDLIGRQTAVVHGVGVNAADVKRYRDSMTTLIWSPRSNIDLYGNTAPVVMYENLGVQIALGTDWLPSGSMNMSRELHCADSVNKAYFGSKFSDKQLWQMVTTNAAAAVSGAGAIGQLKPGYLGDIAIFDARASKGYRAVIEAGVEDVVLVLRGGKVLYGDASLVGTDAVGGADCEDFDVCGIAKKACVKKDIGDVTLADLQATGDHVYPLFFCKTETPTNEPSCTPKRGPTSWDAMASVYAGPTNEDKDGDGIVDAQDNCPNVFNPIRPMDGDHQADADGDGIGDACDKCPLETGENCTPPDSNDVDGDGIPNGLDNCPEDANPDQADLDHDGKGTICDRAPDGTSCDDRPNPGTTLCPSEYTIAELHNPTNPRHPASGSARAIVRNVTVVGVKAKGSGDFGFFIQDGTGPYSGMFVDTPGMTPKVAVGNTVDVEGDYTELFDLSSLTSSRYTVTNPGTTLPFAPVVVTPAVASSKSGGEMWEGMLCEIDGPLAVTQANADNPTADPTNKSDFDEFAVTASNLRVDDYLYDELDNTYAVGTSFQKILGICGFSFSNRKIWPRNAGDLQQ